MCIFLPYQSNCQRLVDSFLLMVPRYSIRVTQYLYESSFSDDTDKREANLANTGAVISVSMLEQRGVTHQINPSVAHLLDCLCTLNYMVVLVSLSLEIMSSREREWNLQSHCARVCNSGFRLEPYRKHLIKHQCC